MHAPSLKRTFHFDTAFSPKALQFGLMKKSLELETLSILKWMSEQMSVFALFAFVCVYSRASVKCIACLWLFGINNEALDNQSTSPSFTCAPYGKLSNPPSLENNRLKSSPLLHMLCHHQHPPPPSHWLLSLQLRFRTSLLNYWLQA